MTLDEQQPARELFRQELQQDVLTGFAPVMSSVVVLMLLFIPYNLLDLPSGLNRRVALHDLAIAALAGALAWAARKGRIRPGAIGPLAMLSALALLSNVLHVMLGMRSAFQTVYVGVLLVAICTTLVEVRWVLITLAIIGAAWLWAITRFADGATVARASGSSCSPAPSPRWRSRPRGSA